MVTSWYRTTVFLELPDDSGTSNAPHADRPRRAALEAGAGGKSDLHLLDAVIERQIDEILPGLAAHLPHERPLVGGEFCGPGGGQPSPAIATADVEVDAADAGRRHMGQSQPLAAERPA